MKTATVGALRNNYTKLLQWLEAGEEILISRRGRTLARLIPENAAGSDKVDWTRSTAYRRSHSRERRLTAAESAAILNESKGNW